MMLRSQRMRGCVLLGVRAFSSRRSLPRIVEPHHHYVVTSEPFHEPLTRVGLPEYAPDHFERDSEGVDVTKAVHMECAPSDPLAEALYIEGLIAAKRGPIVATVAACNLAAPDASIRLQQLKESCEHVVGVRYVVDYAGPFGDAPATHVFVSRHGEGADGFLGAGKGVDFLRDPAHSERFEAGFASLAELGLTFDLQCAPVQLAAAAELIGRHPGVRVVVDHLGKPRLGGGDAADALELAVWREGMEQLAALPNVHVKISMLGYALPGWAADEGTEDQLAGLVRETISRFGPHRCMFSTNWWSGGAMANSDGRDDVEISMADLWARYLSWVEHEHDAAALDRLFAGSAEAFYGI
jgi:predicted TIM-barrel fold metal-dependent hydrolase